MRSADFEAAIATLERVASQSPALTETRLDYADFLVDDDSVPCAVRLMRAQAQLDRVTVSPVTQVIFPDGWARAARTQYRIQLAAANCDQEPGQRQRDLRGAIDSARQSVSLYRDELDYDSMAIMQFNLSATSA